MYQKFLARAFLDDNMNLDLRHVYLNQIGPYAFIIHFGWES